MTASGMAMDGNVTVDERGAFVGPTRFPLHRLMNEWDNSATGSVSDIVHQYEDLTLAAAMAGISFGLAHPDIVAAMRRREDELYERCRPFAVVHGQSS